MCGLGRNGKTWGKRWGYWGGDCEGKGGRWGYRGGERDIEEEGERLCAAPGTRCWVDLWRIWGKWPLKNILLWSVCTSLRQRMHVLVCP
jgi:hypothetical protein